MPLVRFAKLRPPLDVEQGQVLMEALLKAGLPVASSCNGDGVCAKCRVQVLNGSDGLTPENAREKFLREKHSISPLERVSCQTQVIGDITIDTSYW
jgi:2Fe-2S ferredoxin